MSSYFPDVYRQALVVLEPGSGAPDVLTPRLLNESAGLRAHPAGVPWLPYAQAIEESLILRRTLPSVPASWDEDICKKYMEVGDALSEMAELGYDDEWGIDTPVYYAACYIAAQLMASSFPAPRVFTHGPKSVVFNWSKNSDSLYLTVSADRVAALISSPERIERRVEYTVGQLVDPSVAAPSLRAALSKRPIKLLVSGAVSDPPEPAPAD